MKSIFDLEPKVVFHYFNEICQVPRPSKHEEKIIAYLKEFGKKHNLETIADECGNILIKKPATKGLEDRQTVILQSHMDMVCEKNNDTVHDFMKDPIETVIDGKWLKAKGTTLGADNGIGVSAELAVLASDDIEHGPIECLFTVDEETGLTGAFAMKKGFLGGDILINLDSEDEGELFIGCAGGIDTVATFDYTEQDVPAGYFFFRVTVKGLTGGHSGDDINKNRANANKLLTRYIHLLQSKHDVKICEIAGGNLHNAIAREASALLAVPVAYKEPVRVDLNILSADIEKEYAVTEPNMQWVLESESRVEKCIDDQTAKNLILAVQGVQHGVFAMSQDIPDMVETSSNLASIKMKEGHKIVIGTSQRSSILSSRDDMANTIRATFRLAGAKISHGDGYPGWQPNPKSAILAVAAESYKRLFNKEPKVRAIHAGLECGLFLEKYPNLDMVSFGPTLRGVHSPDERMDIATVDLWWKHLLDVLKNIPTVK